MWDPLLPAVSAHIPPSHTLGQTDTGHPTAWTDAGEEDGGHLTDT